jgi:hypothetical protein
MDVKSQDALVPTVTTARPDMARHAKNHVERLLFSVKPTSHRCQKTCGYEYPVFTASILHAVTCHLTYLLQICSSKPFPHLCGRSRITMSLSAKDATLIAAVSGVTTLNVRLYPLLKSSNKYFVIRSFYQALSL